MFERVGGAVAIANFTGGQPTLKADLDKIMLGAVERLPNLSLVHYTTNALTPDADLALIETVLSVHPYLHFRVSLSLDGLDQEHDRVRGLSGNFKKTKELFDSLIKQKKRFSNLCVGLSTTVGAYNADRLRTILESFSGKDFHTFDFYHQNDTYYGEAPEEKMALDSKPRADAASLLSRRPASGVEGVLNRIFLSLDKNISKQPLCAAGDASVSVYPKGEIKRCYYLDESVGDLRSCGHDVLDVVKQKKIELHKDCRKCWNTCNAYSTMAARPLEVLAALVKS
jgi:MoaA/NifB/PqqE/SkfB family radical SAM enzyme